jgi:hypothetical protein
MLLPHGFLLLLLCSLQTLLMLFQMVLWTRCFMLLRLQPLQSYHLLRVLPPQLLLQIPLQKDHLLFFMVL